MYSTSRGVSISALQQAGQDGFALLPDYSTSMHGKETNNPTQPSPTNEPQELKMIRVRCSAVQRCAKTEGVCAEGGGGVQRCDVCSTGYTQYRVLHLLSFP